MATVVNDRDLQLEATTPRLAGVALPSNVTVPGLAGAIASSKNVSLAATSQIFQIPKSGSISPANITLTATISNLVNTPTLTIQAGAMSVTPALSSGTFTFTPAQMTSDTVTLILSLTEASITYTDTMTFVKVREGVDSVNVVLSNENVTLPADSVGNVLSYATASGLIKVYQGINDITSVCTFALVSNSAGLTQSIIAGPSGSGGQYSVTGGFPTATDLASITYSVTFGTTVIPVVFTLSKARAGAGSFTLVGSSSMTIAGSVVTKTGPTNGSWDAQVYSVQPLVSGASVSIVPAQNNKGMMIGLNTDPTTDASYTSIDYAVYLDSLGNATAYESGSLVAAMGTYVSGDVWQVVYDNTSIVYYKNGVVKRTVSSVTASQVFYLDSSFYDVGASASVTFAAQGAKGSNGTVGVRGSVQLSVGLSGSTATWSDTVAASAVNSYTGVAPIRLDTVTEYNNSVSFSQTKFYDGAAWQVVSVQINGNLLVNGTVGANAFVANAITADKIDTSNLTIKNSSGTVVFSAGVPLAPANMTGVISTSNLLSAANASTFLSGAAIDSAYINNLRTSNYAEDGSGNPTAGAKLSSTGTALKIANNGLQIGTVVFTDYWIRLVQGIDGASGTALIWRGNNDSTTRGGAPNINCISIATQCDQVLNSNFQQTYLTYTLTPTSYTSYSDNLDAMTQIHMQFFQFTSSTAPFTETYQPMASRTYDGASGIVQGCLHWGWRFSGTGSVSHLSSQVETNGAYDSYIRVRIGNTYGFSATKDLYGGGSSAAVGRTMTSANITGQTGSSGGGGGSAGGACPAPWVKITLINGRKVDASDLFDGSVVAAVNDNDLSPLPKGGIIRNPQIIWRQRIRITMADGRFAEYSHGHRLCLTTGEWVCIQDLRPGDHILGPVENIVQSVEATGEGPVVSFQVEGGGTYFSADMLSHNTKNYL